jgi:hypothetical protein
MLLPLLAPLTVALAACSAGSPRPQPSPGVVAPESAAAVVRSSEPWTFQEQPGRIFDTDNYRIYTTDPRAHVMSRLPAFMESALTHYTTTLGPLPFPETRLETFLFAKRWQWSRMTQQLMGDKADLYLRIPRGGYASSGRAILYNIGVRDTLAIAAHEGWHQYTQSAFREGLPVWLEEGIAAYMEGYRAERRGGPPRFLPWANVERFDQLRTAAARGRLLTLEELLESTPQEILGQTTDGALTYYAQVWALVHFLNEGEGGRYAPALRAAIRDAAEGRMRRTLESRLGTRAGRAAALSRRGKGAFLAYITLDLGHAQTEFEAFIQRLVRTGSKDRIVMGESPFAR